MPTKTANVMKTTTVSSMPENRTENVRHGLMSEYLQECTENTNTRHHYDVLTAADGCHGSPIATEADGRNIDCKVLSFETIDFTADWCTMSAQIFNQLDKINEYRSQTKINKLCESIRSLRVELGSFDVHVFGSQDYGFATEQSDVDLYLEIGDTFDGDKSDDIENKTFSLVTKFAQQLDLRPEEFKNIIKIIDVRVPIVRFYYVPANVSCDISFSGDLALYNSKLLKTYLSMDPTVKWLACVIVRNWAVRYNLIDPNIMFPSYALIWLVLFYLMEENVVPPLVELIKNAPANDRKIVEGWDCAFGEWSGAIKHQNRPKLLFGFFRFYADKRKLMDNVLCTFTGKCMKKNSFFAEFSELPEINGTQRAMFKSHRSDVNSSFQNYHGLAVQDPFKFSYNLTVNIYGSNLTDFCEICDKTMATLSKTKCCNIF